MNLMELAQQILALLNQGHGRETVAVGDHLGPLEVVSIDSRDGRVEITARR